MWMILLFFLGVFNGFSWSYSVINAEKMNTITTMCSHNQGLDKARNEFGKTTVFCKDGAIFSVDR